MTRQQREDAELLRDLGRPAEIISANSGLPLDEVRAWLASGRWPGPRQGQLFDPSGLSPRSEMAKPVTNLRDGHGLRLFASDTAGRPGTEFNIGKGAEA